MRRTRLWEPTEARFPAGNLRLTANWEKRTRSPIRTPSNGTITAGTRHTITVSYTHLELGCALITRDGQEFELKAQGWNPLKEEK